MGGSSQGGEVFPTELIMTRGVRAAARGGTLINTRRRRWLEMIIAPRFQTLGCHTILAAILGAILGAIFDTIFCTVAQT